MKADEAAKEIMELLDRIDLGMGNQFTVGGTFKECKVDIDLLGFEMVSVDGSVFQVIVIEKH